MGAPSAVSCIDARSLSYWLCAARGRTFAQNQVWCEIAALSGYLTARMQLIALTGPADRWEPKKLASGSMPLPGASSGAAAASGSSSTLAGAGHPRSSLPRRLASADTS
jgi:hypothetical protein